MLLRTGIISCDFRLFSMRRLKVLFLMAFVFVLMSNAQDEKEVMLKYGDMDNWLVREVEESILIGGETKILHEIGPRKTIKGDVPYRSNSQSPWATSNVMAKVGVTKCSVSVYPEVRDKGKCARLETRMETVKVLGIVDITVLATGSIYLGGVDEPIKGVKNPLSKIANGIPFTGKPKALRFDYKAALSGANSRKKVPGFGKTTDVPGKDYPEVYMVLQKRWEDEAGNIYAKRVATLLHRFEASDDWVNNFTLDLEYGDISDKQNIDALEKLMVEEPYYDWNSLGEMKPVIEMGWAEPDEATTHVILRFSSSFGGAFIGSAGNKLWIDNVRFVY